MIQDTHHDRQDEQLPEYIAICFVGIPHVEGYAFDKFDLICFVFISNLTTAHSCGQTPIDMTVVPDGGYCVCVGCLRVSCAKV